MAEKRPEEYRQRSDKLTRNEYIWEQVVIRGRTQSALAKELGLTEQRVSQVVRQVMATIPAEEKDHTRKFRAEQLAKLREIVMEIAFLPPAPAFAPNGKPHVDPSTGATVYDYGTRLAAVDRALKLDERVAKLTGTDNSVDHTVHVSVEAQAAVQEQADKIGASFAHLIPESPEVAGYAARGG